MAWPALMRHCLSPTAWAAASGQAEGGAPKEPHHQQKAQVYLLPIFHCQKAQFDRSHANAHGGKAFLVPSLPVSLQQEGELTDSHQNSHWREAVHLPPLSLPLRPESEPLEAHTDTLQRGNEEEQKCPLVCTKNLSPQEKFRNELGDCTRPVMIGNLVFYPSPFLCLSFPPGTPK